MLLIHQISPFSKKDASYNARKVRSLKNIIPGSYLHCFLFPSFSPSSLLLWSHNQDRQLACIQDTLCHAAHHPALQPVPTVCGEGDQVQPSALPLCSASSTSALATSDAHKTEEVIESLSSFVLA